MWRYSPSCIERRNDDSSELPIVVARSRRNCEYPSSNGRCWLSSRTSTPWTPANSLPRGTRYSLAGIVPTGAPASPPITTGARSSATARRVSAACHSRSSPPLSSRRVDATRARSSPTIRWISALHRSSRADDSAAMARTHTSVTCSASTSAAPSIVRVDSRRWATTSSVVSVTTSSTPPMVPSSSNSGLYDQTKKHSSVKPLRSIISGSCSCHVGTPVTITSWNSGPIVSQISGHTSAAGAPRASGCLSRPRIGR